ncbi:MAG: HAD-IC family P-type ATPase, partial [Candidatus Omnitrophica bacterium]|nr:HAD-IC family P-type ATPase [Candidatus Omnitrophota bacterium]
MENEFKVGEQPEWHALSTKEIFERFEVNPDVGITNAECAKRRERFGSNVLTQKKGQPVWFRFLVQFNQPLVYILLAASFITLLLREWVDSAVIFGVVLVNSIIGFIQESKALKALDALSRTMTTQTTVLRNGSKHRVLSTELVPGDIVLMASGDKIPADMRIFQSRELQVNESALTGESLPVQKKLEPLDPGTVLADRTNMLYASTLVTYGQGRGVVIATGDRTEVGRISQLISTAEELETPLTKKIARFSHFLLYVILGMAGITFLVGLLRGQSAVEMFMASVALAVSAIPEGLPAAVTITLAIGVSRMARRRAIIRKLPAVETLGSTMMICSDKTGTLTKNQMTVQRIVAGSQAYEVTGAGYTPEGRIQKDSEPVDPALLPALKECLLAGVLCNESVLVEKGGRYEVEGDPTEGALIVSALKGAVSNPSDHEMRRLDAVPFESEHQYMATLHDAGEGRPRLIYMKGSVEQILVRCDNGLGQDGNIVPLDKRRVIQETEIIASGGLRVLAFARGLRPFGLGSLTHENLKSGMTFLGLQAMIDPPREEAIWAVQSCHTAGITVKMITGDHVLTATTIARQLGLKSHPKAKVEELVAVTGKDI